MSKKESKVAWPKEDAFSREVLSALQAGRPVVHGDILKAVDDKDHLKVFDPSSAHPLKKENFVIFQYGIVLRREDGRVAVFDRAKVEQGEKRITPGPSMLLSVSTPDPPFHALPRMIEHQLLFSGKEKIRGFEPLGLAWNAVAPTPEKRAAPVYLFALYSHTVPDHLFLHGRFKDSPDEFYDWVSPAELPARFGLSGYIDQRLATQIAGGVWMAVDEGAGGVVFSPESRLLAEMPPGSLTDHEIREYSHGHGVFISHVSEDSFSAFALYHFLLTQSSRTILAKIDIKHLRDGSRLSNIEKYIQEADGVVLVITPSLLEKSARRAREGQKDWVKHEIEYAKRLGKPVIGFKLGTLHRPDYLESDLIVHNRDAHTNWLVEVEELVHNIQKKFNRLV